MRRWACVGVVAAGVASAVASAQALPHISSVASSHRHLVLIAQFGDLAPATVAVAVKRVTENGGLVKANVVYTARLRAATRTVRWRSPQRFKRGTYWVQVSGVETGGVPDCPPRQRDCARKYSNVARVAVRK